MKCIKHISLVILLSFLSIASFAQNDFCSSENTSFKTGEKAYFSVYYNIGFIWAHAGNAAFNISDEMLNGYKTYHIVGTGVTIGSYDFFFKVRDRYETFIDKESLLPLKFYRNVNEGGIKFTNEVTFNHINGHATSTTGTYAIPHCTQDVLSTIYYARNINYNKYRPGDKIPFSMFLDDKVYSIYIRYLGKEKITTKYGTFNAIKIAPLLIKGTIFEGGEKMLVWVSDDGNHIPVRIESPILVGSVKVDLMGYENLRNPLTSLISRQK